MEACSSDNRKVNIVRRRLFVKQGDRASHVSVTQEKRSSGVFSFFRWFKKSDEHLSGGDAVATRNTSLPASPNLKRNQSISCGSLLSTATVSSFSFVNPGKYRQVSLRQINPGPDTDTYRNRIKQRDHLRELDKDMTLKKKYKLLGGSSTSIYHSVENLRTCARPAAVLRSASLGRKKRKAPQPPADVFGHRRTVSDSEARRVHVKGKRKAPPPPTPTSSMNNTLSRSWRKKRPAPDLPFNMEEKNRLLHSLEKLRAHAEQQSCLSNSPLLGVRSSLCNDVLKLESGVLKVNKEETPSCVKDCSVPSSPVSPRPWYKRNRQPSYSEKIKVKEEDDWLSEGNIQPRKSSVSEADKFIALLTQSDLGNDVLSAQNRKPSDSPKPGTGSNPFIITRLTGDNQEASTSVIKLSTNDEHKPSTSDTKQNVASNTKPSSSSDNHKKSHNFFSDGIKHSLSSSSCNSNTSTQSGSKNSTNNHSSRFNFFHRSSDDSKRRSQVTLLANISALDREASEIIEREQQRQKALRDLENAKYYTDTDDGTLDHEYSEIVERNLNGDNMINNEQDNNRAEREEVHETKRASTRELISLFNAIGNVTRVTVNTAFFSRDTAAHLFSRSDKKFNVNCKHSPSENRREVFKRIENFEELEEWAESPRGVRRHPSDQRVKRLGFGEPYKLARENSGEDDEGVTIEELEDERVEKPSTSKPETSRAYKFHRSPSPSIPTILELSEHSSATTPASTMNPASEFSSLASTPLSPQVPSAPTFSNPRQTPQITQLVWTCPQCTLENLKWKFVCDACNFFRPFSIEMRSKTSVDGIEPGAATCELRENAEDPSILETNPNSTKGMSTETSDVLKESSSASSGPGFCSRPSGDNTSGLNRKAPYYMSDVLESPDKQVSMAERLKALPSTSILDPEPITPVEGAKIKKALKGNESNEMKENREVEELRKARLAFFAKTNRNEEAQASCSSKSETPADVLLFNGEKDHPKVCDEADLKKIKELLREMKHSLPASPNSIMNENTTSSNIDHEIKPFLKFQNSRAIKHLKTSSTTTNTTSSSFTQSTQNAIKTNNSELIGEKNASSSKASLVSKTTSVVTSKPVTENLQLSHKPIPAVRRKLSDTTLNSINVNGNQVKNNNNQTKVNGAHIKGSKQNGILVDDPNLNVTIVSAPIRTNTTSVVKLNGSTGQEHEVVMKKTNNTSLTVDDMDYDDNSLDRIRLETDKKAEIYLMKSKTILEDILVKKPTSKVSISVQTNSSIVRKSEIKSTNPNRDAYNVSVPVVYEEYRINPDGSLVTSLAKKNKMIGTGTFQLIRSRDFVSIEAAKTGGQSLLPNGIPNHTYANVDDDTLSTSTCTSSTNCTSQVLEDRSSNLIRSKCFADFKARFVSSNNNVNTVAVNRLLKRLEAAIANGEHHKAASLAKELARLKISCSVTRQSSEESAASKHIQINMYVEDKVSHQGPIPLSVVSTMTVSQLKRKLEIEYDIPSQVQRWILGKSLGTNEQATLEQMGVSENGTPVFLYLVAPESPGVVSNTSNINGPTFGIPGPHSNESPILSVPGPSTQPLSPDTYASTSFGTLNSAESSRASSLERDVSELQNSTTQDYIVEEFEDDIQTNPTSRDLSLHPRNFSPLQLRKFTPASPPPTEMPPFKFSPATPEVTTSNKPSSLPTPTISHVTPNSNVYITTVSSYQSNVPPSISNAPPMSTFNTFSPDIPYNLRASTSPSASNILYTSSTSYTVSSVSNLPSSSSQTCSPNTSDVNTPSNESNISSTSRQTYAQDTYNPVPIIHSLSPTSNEFTPPSNKTSPTSNASPLPSPAEITLSSHAPLNSRHGTLFVGWKCPMCTLINTPTRPMCAACMNLRPGDYRVPESYEKKEKEAQAQKVANYQELVLLERADLVVNTETFDCPICFTECTPPDGAVLRECLHFFCKQCLVHTIHFNTEVQVKCPYRDRDYSCESHLQEREIKALVSPDQFEAHLAKSLAQAETQIQNAFHCKTPDCRGWCIFEDNVNEFRCPVCTHLNCLTCQAIHDGLNCKQYQDHMKADSDTNVDARRTRDMLDEMVDRGEAMVCPQCHVVLMKKWGCDWLRCSMCKTEICWVTRGPRWGPNGKGDISSGCKCGVNGVKCHPKCNYCH